MAISRGSIHHSIFDDFLSFLRVNLQSKKYLSKASELSRSKTCKLIEDKFAGYHASLFPFARTAFYALLESLNLPKGSEVLMTPFNIAPMAQVVQELGYKPVFVDINLDDFGPNDESLVNALKRKPACFLLTYLFGYVPDIDLITSRCQFYSVPIIEDISQNIGSTYKGRLLGTFGVAAFYSASLTKYVDAYNGAFTLTNNSNLAFSLGQFTSNRLISIDTNRIQKVVFKTLIWNLALSPRLFSLVTFQILRILKLLNYKLFNALLGPSIPPKVNGELPRFYFEDISEIQCSKMYIYLKKLDHLLRSRKLMAELVKEAGFNYNFSVESPFERGNTYWQYICPVKDVSTARNLLFKHGVETGTTNLPNLASLFGIKLNYASKVKDTRLFIPLHKHSSVEDYVHIFEILADANQLLEPFQVA